MARTTGIITGTQYTKLVDIRLGRTVRTNTETVGALITRGLVELVDGRAVIADAERAESAIAEYHAWADKKISGWLGSRYVSYR